MRRNRALQQLSPIHAIALRLDALGADRELIAACLRIAPEAVPPLLEVAAAKFARAEQELSAGPVREIADGMDSEGHDAPASGETTAPYENRPSGGREGEEGGQERSIS